MKIEKAIGILEEDWKSHIKEPRTDLRDAQKLGIDALKLHQERRQRFPNLPHLLLPGETEE